MSEGGEMGGSVDEGGEVGVVGRCRGIDKEGVPSLT